MKLCYYHDTDGNFGDDLNAWLWPKLLPDLISGTCKHGQEFYEENNQQQALLYGIGTILDERIPLAPKKYIAGAGTGYFAAPKIDDSFNIYFVRGPETAKKIGVDTSLAISDPAILLKELISMPESSRYPASIIMHCDTAKTGYWKNIAQDSGVHHIDPRSKKPIEVINQILASKYIITESLHGAIIADAFGIPWLPITTMPHINHFKWDDWCHSVGLDYQPEQLISIYDDSSSGTVKKLINRGKCSIAKKQLKTILKEARSFNSSPQLISSHISHMLEKLEQLKVDATHQIQN
jgi:succinoglycan biosynthesis protein ExoV